MDLLISTNASASRATVQWAAPGELRSDAFVVRPGESVLDVPYDAWLARVGETVELRELQDAPAEPREREQGFWTTPLAPRQTSAIFAIFMGVAFLQDTRVQLGTSLRMAWLLAISAMCVHLALTRIAGKALPDWISHVLLAAFAVLAGITLFT